MYNSFCINLHFSNRSSVCDDPLNVILYQKSNVTRPTGDLTLFCEMSGVPLDQMEMYLWKIHNKKETLYEYMVSSLGHPHLLLLSNCLASKLFQVT